MRSARKAVPPVWMQRAWPAAGLQGGAVSAPFILAPGEQHVGALPLERPFFRFASGQTDGLAALAEVRLPPLKAGRICTCTPTRTNCSSCSTA
jgi:hypothetical protein